MNSKQFEIIYCFLSLFFLFNHAGFTQNSAKEKHIEVALRMLGHEVLLHAKDSTSRVLPITKENNQYRIQFESDFVFNSEDLVTTVKQVVDKTGIASNYIVEVENCKTSQIAYSFEVNYLEKEDIVPCHSRVQPKSCYNIVFTIVDELVDNNKLANKVSESSKETFGSGVYLGIFALIVLVILLIYFLRKIFNPKKTNPNLISLGAYHFDKHNTELVINNQRIELTSKETDLLILLYNSANSTVERDVILNMVWGDEGDYIGRTVDVFISKLRKKLEFDSKVKIVNVRGVGYKLVMDT
ncbi:winged helix-turn-helix domain-containing protein [uncultured Algibacter sp.]|uniref:winged helix-turn-helix domain-containing protein n=1 Tax=uncultured Algibacter sp. TaxID=298659 RepID=UPI00261C566E|nr:winged helix-turn-helix domain-containing protein [uncultured Algibacter sp.]